ncbi:MAG: nicotinamide mononucleotide transporter [Phycisphaerae bacterium]|nr:nicotinamide mononucleotide transporter [Gemmatimonadaceae bacterium]
MGDACAWLVAHGTSCAEVAGFIFGVINVYLTVREKIWSWPVGIVNAILSAVVYYQIGFFSDFGLQFVYMAMSAYGWYHWLHGGAQRAELRVTRTAGSTASILTSAALVGWLIMFNITKDLPRSSLPQFDSLLVALSLVAQWMMTRKLRETWLLWIVINIGYVVMQEYRGLHLYAILNGIYGVLAIYGHIEWTRSYARTSHASS